MRAPDMPSPSPTIATSSEGEWFVPPGRRLRSTNRILSPRIMLTPQPNTQGTDMQMKSLHRRKTGVAFHGGDPNLALEIEDLSVSFGGVLALSEFSCTVHPQQVVAIVGPNGAGKSTLINAISGLLGDNARGAVY